MLRAFTFEPVQKKTNKLIIRLKADHNDGDYIQLRDLEIDLSSGNPRCIQLDALAMALSIDRTNEDEMLADFLYDQGVIGYESNYGEYTHTTIVESCTYFDAGGNEHKATFDHWHYIKAAGFESSCELIESYDKEIDTYE